jgi:hypothetical protein
MIQFYKNKVVIVGIISCSLKNNLMQMKDLAQTFEYLKQFLTEERLAKIEHFSQESSDFVLPVVEDIYQFRNAAAIVRSVEAWVS